MLEAIELWTWLLANGFIIGAFRSAKAGHKAENVDANSKERKATCLILNVRVRTLEICPDQEVAECVKQFGKFHLTYNNRKP